MSIEDVKKLREMTGAGFGSAKEALEEASGDMDKAVEILRKKGLASAAKKAGREARQGLIEAYIHSGRIGSIVEVNCETDFVARTEDFKNFAKEIAMQVAATDLEELSVQDLLKQPYIKDSEKTIEDLINELIGKIGENVVIRRFVRYELGEQND